MPIFEYCCEKCGSRFEKLVRGREKVVCPECGAAEPAKLFSTFGVKSGNKFTSSTGSACGTCEATSCKGCNK